MPRATTTTTQTITIEPEAARPASASRPRTAFPGTAHRVGKVSCDTIRRQDYCDRTEQCTWNTRARVCEPRSAVRLTFLAGLLRDLQAAAEARLARALGGSDADAESEEVFLDAVSGPRSRSRSRSRSKAKAMVKKTKKKLPFYTRETGMYSPTATTSSRRSVATSGFMTPRSRSRSRSVTTPSRNPSPTLLERAGAYVETLVDLAAAAATRVAGVLQGQTQTWVTQLLQGVADVTVAMGDTATEWREALVLVLQRALRGAADLPEAIDAWTTRFVELVRTTGEAGGTAARVLWRVGGWVFGHVLLPLVAVPVGTTVVLSPVVLRAMRTLVSAFVVGTVAGIQGGTRGARALWEQVHYVVGDVLFPLAQQAAEAGVEATPVVIEGMHNIVVAWRDAFVAAVRVGGTGTRMTAAALRTLWHGFVGVARDVLLPLVAAVPVLLNEVVEAVEAGSRALATATATATTAPQRQRQRNGPSVRTLEEARAFVGRLDEASEARLQSMRRGASHKQDVMG